MSKAQYELTLVSTMGNNQKGFLKCVSSKRGSIDNFISFDEDGYLTSRDADKAGMFKAFFAAVLSTSEHLEPLEP